MGKLKAWGSRKCYTFDSMSLILCRLGNNNVDFFVDVELRYYQIYDHVEGL